MSFQFFIPYQYLPYHSSSYVTRLNIPKVGLSSLFSLEKQNQNKSWKNKQIKADNKWSDWIWISEIRELQDRPIETFPFKIRFLGNYHHLWANELGIGVGFYYSRQVSPKPGKGICETNVKSWFVKSFGVISLKNRRTWVYSGTNITLSCFTEI